MIDDTLVRIGRLIGKPPAWERIVRALAPPSRFAGRDLRQMPMPEGYLFPVDTGTLIGWNVRFFGSYEPEVRKEIKDRLRAGDVAIDVGANVGWHTLLMATGVGPTGRVFAFEPNPTTRERLAVAIESNHLSQVSVQPWALADCTSSIGFDAPPAGDFWDGTGRLAPGGGSTHVECVTLDSFVADHHIDRVALIKVDVEGWELPVLRGARRTLETLKPAVLFEYDAAYVSRGGGSGEALAHFLRHLGYTLYALDPRRAPLAVSGLDRRVGNFLALPLP